MRYLAIALILAAAAAAETGTAEFAVLTGTGDGVEMITGDFSPAPEPDPGTDSSWVLWHYVQETGPQQKMAPIGLFTDNVFTGGWYGGARIFQGSTGDGTVQWTYEPPTAWSSLGTATVAANTADVFYAVQNWDDGKAAHTAVHCFQAGSSTPVWSWDGTGTFDSGSIDSPGKVACSEDGTVLAVGGAVGGNLAVAFFSPDSAGPCAIFQQPGVAYYPRQLRITADGSRCILRTAATLYRIDTSDGTLESSYALDASNDCFAVSPDGSVVAYGFTAARIAAWDGSQYNLEAGMAVPGYFGGAATIAEDNNTVYFGFYRNDYRTNRIIRYDLSSSSPAWTYDYPVGGGSYQDVMEWMDCSDDGRWLVAGSWGCQTGGGAEVNVFDDLDPTEPLFSIDTPGSMFHVDISGNGQYVTAAGKHVHANQMGSGTDVYMAFIDVMGLEGSAPGALPFSITPNPSGGTFSAWFQASEPGFAELTVFDLSGRAVHTGTAEVTAPGSAAVTVNAGLPAGIYPCRLSFNGTESFARLAVTR